jgi:hypothetical protein
VVAGELLFVFHVGNRAKGRAIEKERKGAVFAQGCNAWAVSSSGPDRIFHIVCSARAVSSISFAERERD